MAPALPTYRCPKSHNLSAIQDQRLAGVEFHGEGYVLVSRTLVPTAGAIGTPPLRLQAFDTECTSSCHMCQTLVAISHDLMVIGRVSSFLFLCLPGGSLGKVSRGHVLSYQMRGLRWQGEVSGRCSGLLANLDYGWECSSSPSITVCERLVLE